MLTGLATIVAFRARVWNIGQEGQLFAGAMAVTFVLLTFPNISLPAFLLIPLLMLPSILSIAFPDENPSLNRSSGAIIPVFIIIAIAVENLVINLRSRIPDKVGKWVSTGIVLILAVISMQANARLVFVDYYQQFKARAWNTSEIGAVIEEFADTIGDEDHAWVVPYPHWVDTRLVGSMLLA